MMSLRSLAINICSDSPRLVLVFGLWLLREVFDVVEPDFPALGMEREYSA
jgi:hypothetical protein